MTVTINGTSAEVPTDLSQITLGKFVEWQQAYGKDLDEELAALLKSECNDIDIDLHIDKEALSWYSFFTGFNFFETYDIDLTDILIQYRILRDLLKQSETAARDYPMQTEWNDEMWAIQDYRVTPGSLMSFGEVVTGKEVVRQISSLGQGKWEALAYLCCIYFRKLGEPYKDILLEERLELMNSLPLDKAMSVAFFLNASISIYRRHLLASMQQALEVKQPPSSLLITKNGAG